MFNHKTKKKGQDFIMNNQKNDQQNHILHD